MRLAQTQEWKMEVVEGEMEDKKGMLQKTVEVD